MLVLQKAKMNASDGTFVAANEWPSKNCLSDKIVFNVWHA